jgi:methylase of polypeptide subunit release factors
MRDDVRVPDALLDEADMDLLRKALSAYTVQGVQDLLGEAGQAALQRGDVLGMGRTLTGADPLLTLIRLFLLGESVDEQTARQAFAPLPLESASAADIVEVSAGEVRALLTIRPYGELGGDTVHGLPWWVVSDFGTDARPGVVRMDHVLGVNGSGQLLAGTTPRDRVGRALDIGTGAGMQALHLSTHAGSVVATDVNERALRFAATTAALSGQHWDLRRGSLFDPVADDQFDLIVANPPYIVSPGNQAHSYRDSGMTGDAVCEALVRGMPSRLAPDGAGQLLANWIVTADESWSDRVGGWLAGADCDAWVWQWGITEPAEYVNLWLADAGGTPGTDAWVREYTQWRDWFETIGAIGVASGLITLWRTDAGTEPVVEMEEVPQAFEQPIAAEIASWRQRQRWLASRSDLQLLDSVLTVAPYVVLDRMDQVGEEGWEALNRRLRQVRGMRWEAGIDESIATLIGSCVGTSHLATPVALLADSLGRPFSEMAEAVLPLVRHFVGRGFLLPRDEL